MLRVACVDNFDGAYFYAVHDGSRKVWSGSWESCIDYAILLYCRHHGTTLRKRNRSKSGTGVLDESANVPEVENGEVVLAADEASL